MRPWLGNGLLAAVLAASTGAQAETIGDALAFYGEHCASCHGAARLGGMGPALLPENLGRLKREDAAEVIASGRAATQMPAFGERLNAAQVEALVELIYTPLPEVPPWGEAEIAASPCTADPSSRRMAASSTSRRATAGSASMISGGSS